MLQYMMVKRYRQNSEMGTQSAHFMRPNGAGASAEVDQILTELVEILLCLINALVASVQTS